MATPTVGGVSDADEAGKQQRGIGLGEASHSALGGSLLIWLMAGAVAAGAIGWCAAKIHASGHAPVGLVSLGVGAVLGVALNSLAVALGVRFKWRLAIGTVLLAALTVVAEHAWLYQDFRGQWQEAREKSAAVAMFRPESPPGPGEYFAHEWHPVLRGADAAMIVVTAVGVVLVGRRFRV